MLRRTKGLAPFGSFVGALCGCWSLEVSLLNGDVIEVVIAEMSLSGVCFEARGT